MKPKKIKIPSKKISFKEKISGKKRDFTVFQEDKLVFMKSKIFDDPSKTHMVRAITLFSN